MLCMHLQFWGGEIWPAACTSYACVVFNVGLKCCCSPRSQTLYQPYLVQKKGEIHLYCQGEGALLLHVIWDYMEQLWGKGQVRPQGY
jgi:hypothetical protein